MKVKVLENDNDGEKDNGGFRMIVVIHDGDEFDFAVVWFLQKGVVWGSWGNLRVEFEKSKQTSHVNGNEERSGGCWNIKLAKYATKVAENMNWDKRKGRGAKLWQILKKKLFGQLDGAISPIFSISTKFDGSGGQLVLSYLFAVHKVCEANKDKPCFPRKIPTITQE